MLPRQWVVGLLAAAVLALFAATPLPLTDGDSALYATVARNAVASGEWILFSFPDGRIFDKPPLTLWLIGVSQRALGTGDWAVRSWHLLLAGATAAATYALARLALRIRQALLAALILLSSAQFFYQGLVPQQDVPLTLFVTLAVYWYLRWEREGRTVQLVIAGAAVALAVLSKGLVGLVLPLLIVGVHLIADRPRLPARAFSSAIAGVITLLLLASPWFILGAQRGGREFIETFLLGGTLGIGRFFRPALSTPSGTALWLGYLAYLVYLPLGVLPWTGWLWPALKEGWSARLRSPVLRVCALWVVGVIVFLSVSPGDKVIRFQLPVLPAFAVLAAAVVEDSRWSRSAAWVSGVLAIILAAALGGMALMPLAPAAAAYLPLVGAFLLPLAVALGAYSVGAFIARPQRGLALMVMLTLTAYGVLIAATMRSWDRISPWRPVARIVKTIAPADARILIFGEPTPFAEYYLGRRVEAVDRVRLAAAWRAGPAVVILQAEELGHWPLDAAPAVVGSAHGWFVVSNLTRP